MRPRNTVNPGNIVRKPYHERVKPKNPYDFVAPAEDDYMPADLAAATQFVLDQQPDEVACYAGSPEVQQSAAEDIASTIFRYGVPIAENFENWRSGKPLREPAAPSEDAASPAAALAAKIAGTIYRPHVTVVN